MAALLACGCAQAAPAVSERAPGSETRTAAASEATEATVAAPVVTAANGRFSARLSAGRATDASILVVTVELARPATAPIAVSGEFEGSVIPFFSDGSGIYRAVFGVPYARKPGATEVKVMVAEGSASESLSLPFEVVDGKYRSEVLKVSPRHINPSRKDMLRIGREKKEVGEIYARITPEKRWQGPFAFPVDSPITSVFGTKRVFNGEFASYHGGLDLRAPTGTEVFAPAPGVVVLAKSLFFTGQTVMLDHGYGVITLYAHLSKMKVKVGEKVARGRLLGLSGMTGRASGPHLHWQAVINRTKVNPLDLTKVMP